jgi:hypothetical protein
MLRSLPLKLHGNSPSLDIGKWPARTPSLPFLTERQTKDAGRLVSVYFQSWKCTGRGLIRSLSIAVWLVLFYTPIVPLLVLLFIIAVLMQRSTDRSPQVTLLTVDELISLC